MSSQSHQLVEQGVKLLDAQKTSDAHRLFLQAVAEDGNDIEALKHLARMSQQHHDWRAAEDRWRAVLAIRPDDAEALFWLHYSLRKQLKLEEAIVPLRELTEANSSDGLLLYTLASLLVNAGYPEESCRYWKLQCELGALSCFYGRKARKMLKRLNCPEQPPLPAPREDLEPLREKVLKDPSLLRSVDSLGRTPLHRAASNGDAGLVQEFIGLGADVNVRGKQSDGTPLLSALSSAPNHDPTETVKILIRSGCDVNAAVAGSTALHSAAADDEPECVSLLTAAGADVNARQVDGATPLHRAAAGDYAECAGLLIAAGADVNAQDNEGRTPLHRAAASLGGFAARVLLREPGLNMSIPDASGRTAEGVAKSEGNRAFLRALAAREV